MKGRRVQLRGNLRLKRQYWNRSIQFSPASIKPSTRSSRWVARMLTWRRCLKRWRGIWPRIIAPWRTIVELHAETYNQIWMPPHCKARHRRETTPTRTTITGRIWARVGWIAVQSSIHMAPTLQTPRRPTCPSFSPTRSPSSSTRRMPFTRRSATYSACWSRAKTRPRSKCSTGRISSYSRKRCKSWDRTLRKYHINQQPSWLAFRSG